MQAGDLPDSRHADAGLLVCSRCTHVNDAVQGRAQRLLCKVMHACFGVTQQACARQDNVVTQQCWMQITHLFRNVLHARGAVLLCVNVSPAPEDYDDTARVLSVAQQAWAVSSAETRRVERDLEGVLR